MTMYEIISILIALGALIISLASYFKATSLSSASIELSINERITSTKERVSDISVQMSTLLSKDTLTSEEEKQIEIYKHSFDSAVENNLNAYEEACAKYLDNKVDRKRFEKNYRIEIRQLVEKQELRKYFDGVTSRYKAILKVYGLWENLEK
jgi:hypothetical protein